MGIKKSKYNSTKIDEITNLRDRIYSDEKHIQNIVKVVDTLLQVLNEGKFDLLKEPLFIKELRKRLNDW